MAEVRHLPVPARAEPTELDRPRPRSVPATVVGRDRRLPARRRRLHADAGAAAPAPAARSSRRRGRLCRQAARGRRAGHAVVPRRRPPAEALNASHRHPSVAESGRACPRAPTGCPPAGATACCAAATACSSGCCTSTASRRSVRAWAAGGAVRIRAEAASERRPPAAVERMRFALGVDHDLRPFQRAFGRDPLLGPLIRRRPWLRPRRRPEPFEALAWAITEQLIDGERAVAIQRRLVARHGAAQRLRRAARRARPPRRSPASPRRARGLRPVAPARDRDGQGRARGGLGPGRPDRRTSRPGGGCGRSRASARGRSSASRCTARAATTSCPAGDLAYIKLVGAPGAAWGGARPRTRCASSSLRTRPFAALAGTYSVTAIAAGTLRRVTEPL